MITEVWGKIDFTCGKCGKQALCAPPLPDKPVCPDCCDDHDYIYGRGEGHYCRFCGQNPPDDWFSP